MHNLTHIYKGLIGLIISLICPHVALVYIGLIYGREVGQEQSKLSKKLKISVINLGVHGGFIWQWSKGNQLDFIGALLGSIIGAILHILYIQPLLWSN